MVFLPLISCVVLSAYVMLRTRLFVIFMVEAVTLLGCSTHLHDQFHIRGSWLERFEWFQIRRYRHFYHHGHHMKNMSLGGISTSWDKFLLTFVEVNVPKGSDYKELNVVPQKKSGPL